MALQSTAVDAPPDVAGVVSTTRPEPSPAIVWAAVPDYSNQPQSTAFSEDVRSLLSGAGAATAVITVVDVSGDTAATLGLSISGGDNLASTAATVGSGVFRLKATHNSVEYLSGSFTFSVVPVASDTLAPTEVLPLSWMANGTTQVDLTFLAPTDPKAPTVDAAGVNEVEIHRSTDGANFSLLATKPVSPGISPQLVQSTVGTVGGTPVVTQSGADWEITAQSGGSLGRGFIQAADGLYFVSAAVSGDFKATVLVKEFGGVLGSFSAAYLMARETLDADSKAIAATSRTDDNTDENSDGLGDNVRNSSQHRLTTGGNQGGEPAIENVTGDRYLRLDRIGNLFTTYFWQPGLSGWQQMGQQTISMMDTVFLGLAVAPRSGDASTITVNFEEFAVTAQAIVSQIDTGLTEGQTYYYKARGIDLAPNTGEFGPTVSVVLGQTSPVVYSNVTESPPALTNPLTYTTVASLPTATVALDSQNSGLQRPGGTLYEVDAGGGDLLIDFTGDEGHVVAFPLNLTNYRHAIIRGLNMLMTKQTVDGKGPPGTLDNRDDYPEEPLNNYHRLCTGELIRIAGSGVTFVDGCILDANGQEADFCAWFARNVAAAQQQQVETVWRNCLFRNNEGEPAGLHADHLQNQGAFTLAKNPVTHPWRLVYENCEFYAGMNGFVIHPSGSGQRVDMKLRRCVFAVIDDNQAPGASSSTGPPIGQARGSLRSLSTEDVWYGKFGTSRTGLIVTQGLAGSGPDVYLAEPGIGQGTGRAGLIYFRVGASPGDTYYNPPPTFVEAQHLGYNYTVPESV